MTDLSSLGARSLGVWTRAEAQLLLTDDEIGSFVRTGHWEVLWRGVYTDGGSTCSPEQRAVAAVLAAGGSMPGQVQPRSRPTAPARRPPRAAGFRAVAAGRTAARAWGFPLIDDDDPATGALEHGLDDVAVNRRLASQRWRGRRLLPQRILPVPRGDVVQLTSGALLTSPARTLADLARLLTHEALVCALDDALHRRLVTPDDLDQRVAALAGSAGGPALRRAVPMADGRAEAPTETLARLLLLPVLPRLEPQVELIDRAARLVARFDLGDRTVRLAVEADGKKGHAGAAMVAKDRRRDRITDKEYGWATERVTWFELRREEQKFVRRVLERHDELTADASRQR